MSGDLLVVEPAPDQSDDCELFLGQRGSQGRRQISFAVVAITTRNLIEVSREVPTEPYSLEQLSARLERVAGTDISE